DAAERGRVGEVKGVAELSGDEFVSGITTKANGGHLAVVAVTELGGTGVPRRVIKRGGDPSGALVRPISEVFLGGAVGEELCIQRNGNQPEEQASDPAEVE
ncbi:MAG: hypothetical protein P8J87_13225, partial [Verrucomicrobiales bacterium]|nr:hypothetical protein [Verrucomicrobiales bacterium]